MPSRVAGLKYWESAEQRGLEGRPQYMAFRSRKKLDGDEGVAMAVACAPTGDEAEEEKCRRGRGEEAIGGKGGSPERIAGGDEEKRGNRANAWWDKQ